MEENEEISEIYEQQGENEFLYNQKAQNLNEINDSFKFKTSLLNLDDNINKLINKDLILSNLGDKDKRLCISYLSLASDLNMLGLDGSFFVQDVLITAGVSRGHRGFQQEKLNEQREVRMARLENCLRTKCLKIFLEKV